MTDLLLSVPARFRLRLPRLRGGRERNPAPSRTDRTERCHRLRGGPGDASRPTAGNRTCASILPATPAVPPDRLVQFARSSLRSASGRRAGATRVLGVLRGASFAGAVSSVSAPPP